MEVKEVKIKNVLLVDPDKALLDGYKSYLESKKIKVSTASSMQEATKVLTNFTPDVVVTELMLEHYDSGFILCKKIKDSDKTKNAAILMLTDVEAKTGYKFTTDTREERSWIKADKIMSKPISAARLYDVACGIAK